MRIILCFLCGHETARDRIKKRILGDKKPYPVCPRCRREVLGEKK